MVLAGLSRLNSLSSDTFVLGVTTFLIFQVELKSNLLVRAPLIFLPVYTILKNLIIFVCQLFYKVFEKKNLQKITKKSSLQFQKLSKRKVELCKAYLITVLQSSRCSLRNCTKWKHMHNCWVNHKLLFSLPTPVQKYIFFQGLNVVLTNTGMLLLSQQYSKLTF